MYDRKLQMNILGKAGSNDLLLMYNNNMCRIVCRRVILSVV